MAKRATDWELVDLGIERPDYFQGFGSSMSNFDEAVTGVGNSPREALEDALEQAASDGTDVETMENEIREAYPDFYEASGARSVEEITGESGGDEDDRQYYVGLRFDCEG